MVEREQVGQQSAALGGVPVIVDIGAARLLVDAQDVETLPDGTKLIRSAKLLSVDPTQLDIQSVVRST